MICIGCSHNTGRSLAIQFVSTKLTGLGCQHKHQQGLGRVSNGVVEQLGSQLPFPHSGHTVNPIYTRANLILMDDSVQRRPNRMRLQHESAMRRMGDLHVKCFSGKMDKAPMGSGSSPACKRFAKHRKTIWK